MSSTNQREVGHESPAQSGSSGKVRIEAPGYHTGGKLLFFTGLHQPHHAKYFDRCCISIHRLMSRVLPVDCTAVMVDSGAFTKLAKFGRYPEPVEVYAQQLHRLWTRGVVRILIACAQDYMCEPFMLAKTGLTIADHQRLTIERYDALLAALTDLFGGPPPFPLMPVLQGQSDADYLAHLAAYGDRIAPGMWVGVGSVCKRQGSPAGIESLLRALHAARPDLRLHGFGVKLTALRNPVVRALLYSADSMAWSFGAAKVAQRLYRALAASLGFKLPTAAARFLLASEGVEVPDANGWREAKAFERQVLGL